jgi:hypothetical protein
VNAIHPRACDLAELTWFDYLIVHSGDLDGPASLHPDLPAQVGELVVRRRLVEDGLRLMQRLHLVDAQAAEDGISFVAGEDAPSFVALLQAQYSDALKARADWIASKYSGMESQQIRFQISERIGSWKAELFIQDLVGGV